MSRLRVLGSPGAAGREGPSPGVCLSSSPRLPSLPLPLCPSHGAPSSCRPRRFLRGRSGRQGASDWSRLVPHGSPVPAPAPPSLGPVVQAQGLPLSVHAPPRPPEMQKEGVGRSKHPPSDNCLLRASVTSRGGGHSDGDGRFLGFPCQLLQVTVPTSFLRRCLFPETTHGRGPPARPVIRSVRQ